MANGAGRILIADDDDTFLQTTADLLRREGFDCACASSAAEATALLAEREFDLLIADIRMPGNEGLELIRERTQAGGGCPVILVTGYPTVATAVDSVHLAVSDYLLKPVDFGDLLSQVQKALASHRALQSIRRLGRRLEAWRAETELLERSLSARPRASAEETLRALARLAHGRAVETLHELKEQGIALSPLDVGEIICPFTGCSRLNSCMHAIKDAVVVLERTKGAFKSKELGALRTKLQLLLASLGEAHSEE